MENQEHIRNLREYEGDEESSQQELVARSYFKNLDITPEELQGRKILDIGSGDSSDFAHYLSEHNISSEVVSVDPTVMGGGERGKELKALGEQLPLKDESFDVVISNNAVPSIYYSYPSTMEMKERIGESLQEMLRVVKEGGEVRFYPVYKGGKNTIFEVTLEYLKSLLEDLQKDGKYEVSITEKEKVQIHNKELAALLIKIRKLSQESGEEQTL